MILLGFNGGDEVRKVLFFNALIYCFCCARDWHELRIVQQSVQQKLGHTRQKASGKASVSRSRVFAGD